MADYFKKGNKETFQKTLFQGLVIAIGLLFLLILVKQFFGQPLIAGFLGNIMVLAAFVIFVFAWAYYKSTVGFTKKKKPDSMSRFFFWGIRIIIFVLLVLGAIGVVMIFNTNEGNAAIFKAVGLGIVTLWACIFLTYFIWAVYFYNINMGLTDEEWNKIYQAKEEKRNGNFYHQDDIDEEPQYNPYKDETFGLPSGTVRGMIAFSLLFGAIAMLVVSFGMTNELDPNSFFWDQYEFFKTAFLMMIAFYFGSRSLQYLRPSGAPQPVKLNPVSGGTQSSDPVSETGKGLPILASDIDPMQSSDSEPPKVEPKVQKDDDFTAVDPMQGK